MQNGIQRQPSLREKLKSSICCFTGTVHHDGEGLYSKLCIPRTPTSPAGSSSSSSWFKLKSPTASDYETPRLRGRNLRPRIYHRRNNRQSQSADFAYDPSSYALNFESETREEFPFRNFSSRLPASPPPIDYSGEIDRYR
ncbi:hypothetical protein VNO77_30363 [Canavalia gladiata]|uniref:Uncharacterized protein n=1 Tax=Canavalia gladiata TaxID=3824 RepID=A0AAN9KN13_CANGL